jgi:hypothetical protein
MHAASGNVSRAPWSPHGGWTEALRRIRSEYAEMPGLHLTWQQASRLLGLEPLSCKVILRWLVDDGYLRFSKGHYVKAL